MKLARDVYIAGVGETVFGKHKEDFDVLGRRAAFQAIRNSNIDHPDMIQSAYVGNAHNGLVTGQAIFKDLGLLGRVPVINVESACSAGAVVVCSKEMVKRLNIDKSVKVVGSTVTSGPYHNRPRDITGDDITENTSKILYEETGIGPEDIDIVELHDAFTIAEILYYECMGFCRKGEGLKFLREGQSTYGGECVFSPRGGMLS